MNYPVADLSLRSVLTHIVADPHFFVYPDPDPQKFADPDPSKNIIRKYNTGIVSDVSTQYFLQIFSGAQAVKLRPQFIIVV